MLYHQIKREINCISNFLYLLNLLSNSQYDVTPIKLFSFELKNNLLFLFLPLIKCFYPCIYTNKSTTLRHF